MDIHMRSHGGRLAPAWVRRASRTRGMGGRMRHDNEDLCARSWCALSAGVATMEERENSAVAREERR